MHRREAGAWFGILIVGLLCLPIIVGWDRAGRKPAEETPAVSPYRQRVVAYHEAGHAVVSMYTPWGREVDEVTIVKNGDKGGTCSYVDLPYIQQTKARFFAVIVGAYGGFCAEELIFGEDGVSTGPSADLQEAATHARNMVYHYAFGESKMFLDRADSTRRDNEAEEIVERAYEQAKATLLAHMDDLHALAAALIANLTLDGEAVRRILPPPYAYTPIAE